MFGLTPAQELVALLVYAVLAAAALSGAQAWAAAVFPSNRLRYVLAWAVGTMALALPILIALDFPGVFASPHANVGWTAIPIAALTAYAAIGMALRRRPAATLYALTFPARVTHLFPIHLAVVIILGTVDILILGVIFLGNIH